MPGHARVSALARRVPPRRLPLPDRPARREPPPAPPARGPHPSDPQAATAPRGRQAVLGLRSPPPARLAPPPGRGHARHGRPLAPPCVALVLAVAVGRSVGPPPRQ